MYYVVSFAYGELCMSLLIVLFFFFFKQKTAYEMRISDWSSDVCSSDLIGARALQRLADGAAHDELPPEDAHGLGDGAADHRLARLAHHLAQGAGEVVQIVAAQLHHPQIGRAHV